MSNYIFIVGQSPHLAKEELTNLLDLSKNDGSIIGDNFLMAENDLEPQNFIHQLGGTIKIAKHQKTVEQLDITPQEWLAMIKTKEDGKIKFGFSLYNGNKKEYKKIEALALSVKKELKNQGHSVRLVSSQETDLSSVIVTKNKLINAELLFIKHQGKWIIGTTEAVQDFEKYAQRDAYRPRKDNRSGMLPPKVAQMMINLAGPDRDKIFLDPFCGSGTILQEAALLGFSKIYGSDSSEKAIADSQVNLDWLQEKFDTTAQINIKKIPVEKISTNLDTKVDLIVAEPFMGDARNLLSIQDTKYLAPIINELKMLYKKAFEQFKKIANPDAKIIFIFPVIDLDGQKIYTLEQDVISQLGWQAMPYHIKTNQLSPAGNVIYNRTGQKIQREITIWKNI
ncbi:methyltransferase domain-containing protein [bacterium]|jgi:tRNA G10  N-methylase Trm11|nr:methyltransferase domain-containing protein [bacterium]